MLLAYGQGLIERKKERPGLCGFWSWPMTTCGLFTVFSQTHDVNLQHIAHRDSYYPQLLQCSGHTNISWGTLNLKGNLKHVPGRTRGRCIDERSRPPLNLDLRSHFKQPVGVEPWISQLGGLFESNLCRCDSLSFGKLNKITDGSRVYFKHLKSEYFPL